MGEWVYGWFCRDVVRMMALYSSPSMISSIFCHFGLFTLPNQPVLPGSSTDFFFGTASRFGTRK